MTPYYADERTEAAREVIARSAAGAGNGSVVGLGSRPSMAGESKPAQPELAVTG